MRAILVLCVVVVVSGGIARTLAMAGVAPRDTEPWWAPQATAVAFERDGAGLDSADVLFTPAMRGAEFDLIGTGRMRGFRPGSADLLVERGSTTSVLDSTDRQLGSVPGTDASWSPDGTRIAFVEGDVLALSAASGADVRQLVGGIVPPSSDLSGPVWSPDGTSIAIATTSAAGSAVEIVPVDGSETHLAFDGGGDNVDPSWSRDGSMLAFERNDGGRWTIWLVAPDGTGAHEAIGGGANNRFPQWSPAGGRLAFLSDRGGAWGLYVGAPDGAAQELIGAVAPDSPARWSPDGSALAVAAIGDCGRFGIYVVGSSPLVRPVRRSNQCHIDGTPGADVMYGTPYYDVINGYGGNDSLFAGNGNDVVYGGLGNDAIGGGPGNDVIYGGPGNDILSGGTGNDVIYAGPGRDRIGCGPGNDTAYIRPGDTVRDCEHLHRS